jgi:putative hydrolase of the HAD superfamily
MIECVTFDLDDTLWAVDPVIEQANRELWQWLEAHAPEVSQTLAPADLSAGSALHQQLLQRAPEIAHSVSQVRLRLLEQGCRAAGHGEERARQLAAAAFEVFLHARHRVEPFEHAQPVLERLRREGYLIGALSNGNADLARLPIGELFDFQYNADGVGAAKPHPAMFERALAHTGLRAHQVVHIGDHPINDVQAARQVGMWTIWVNLPGQQWPQPARADATVNQLAAIPAALARIAQRAAAAPR